LKESTENNDGFKSKFPEGYFGRLKYLIYITGSYPCEGIYDDTKEYELVKAAIDKRAEIQS